MKLLIGLILFQTTFAFGSELLVPDSTVNFENYSEKCTQENYQCTFKYFANLEMQKPTPTFDAFIDAIDLTSKTFIDAIPKSIQNILQTESISAEQLEMLVRLLDQVSEQAKDSKMAKQLNNELKYVLSQLPTENFQPNKESFVIFFKKPMSTEAFRKIKKSYLALPYTQINFNQIPKKAFLNDKNVVAAEPLVTGQCQTASLNFEAQTNSWKIMSEKSCSWSEGFSNSTTGITTTLKENKGWVLTGALLVGAAILASQYEVSFQF